MSQLSRSKASELLKSAFAELPDVVEIVRGMDPYGVNFTSDLEAELLEYSQAIWDRLRDIFPHTPPRQLLENAAAAATFNPVGFSLICMFAKRINTDPECLVVADSLTELFANVIKGDPIACAVGGVWGKSNERAPPDLAGVTYLKPGLRLRFSLAHGLRSGETVSQLIARARRQARATDSIRKRELIQALELAPSLGIKVGFLNKIGLHFLTPPDKSLLLESSRLRKLTLPSRYRSKSSLQTLIRALERRSDELAVRFSALEVALEGRDFSAVNGEIEGWDFDPFLKTLGAQWWTLQTFKQITSTPKSSSNQPCDWTQLSLKSIDRLNKLNKTISLPSWWVMSAKEIAQALLNGEIDDEEIDLFSRKRLGASWTSTEFELFTREASLLSLIPPSSSYWLEQSLLKLLEAAQYHPNGAEIFARRLGMLSDARPILELLPRVTSPKRVRDLVSRALESLSPTLKWGKWVIPCLGTPQWYIGESSASKGLDVITLALRFIETGGVPIDLDGFKSALFQKLCRTVVEPSKVARRDHFIYWYLQLFPEQLEPLFKAVGVSPLEGFLSQCSLLPEACEVLFSSIIGDHYDAEAMEVLRRIQYKRVSSLESLESLLVRDSFNPKKIVWEDAWLKLSGTMVERATTLSLAARRDPTLLKSFVAIFGNQAMVVGLSRASKILSPFSPRDAAILELSSILGPELVNQLSAVLSMIDQSVVTGFRLDRCYRRYPLPKQSGGTRVISAPHPLVKKIQRVILDRLIQPLGAHDAAYGFVPGRSIRHNAELHVGRSIVANIDIRNCFPSVRWSLVLGALKRDLGEALSPAAISLLVDICTAEGGLPIGAPTSPALLNRVLLRTDEVLSKAADQLGCRYTRYADDLTFSGDHGAVRLLGIATRTLSQIGLQIDPKKTSIYRPGRRQIVTGLVVNEKVNVPRRLRRRMRAAVHAVERHIEPHWNNAPEPISSLEGRLAFSYGMNPQQAAPLLARLRVARRWQPDDLEELGETEGEVD